MSNLSELLPSGGAQNVVDFVASGTLPNGKPVILNSNGTVTAVAESSGTGTVIPASSSPQALSAYQDAWFSIAFSPNSANVFVLAYRETSGGSRRGSCVIGTVSGTSISFSSVFVFNSNDSYYIDIAFDPSNPTTFAVAYTDIVNNSNYAGTVRLGTISNNNSISYGSSVSYQYTGNTTQLWNSVDFIASGKLVIAYNSTASPAYSARVLEATVSGTTISINSIVVFLAYAESMELKADPNAANTFVVVSRKTGGGTQTYAYVGTVSGNTISIGTKTIVYSSGSPPGVHLSFDPNTANKFVITYIQESVSPASLMAVICTRSGNNISVGTAVQVSNNRVSQFTGLEYNPHTANQFVVTYKDMGANNASMTQYGTATVCSVSGSTITVDGSYVYNAYASSYNTIAFDPSTSSKFVVPFYSASLSGGAAILGNLSGTVIITNLTDTNLIGISAEAIASGATGEINVFGGLNEGQSSLTPASIYYVQGNGSISTVATAPAQKIGKAMSATTLNIKDL